MNTLRAMRRWGAALPGIQTEKRKRPDRTRSIEVIPKSNFSRPDAYNESAAGDHITCLDCTRALGCMVRTGIGEWFTICWA